MCSNIRIKAMLSHVRQVCRGGFDEIQHPGPPCCGWERLQRLLQLCLIRYTSFQRIQAFYILQHQDRCCSAVTKQCFIGLVCSKSFVVVVVILTTWALSAGTQRLFCQCMFVVSQCMFVVSYWSQWSCHHKMFFFSLNQCKFDKCTDE